MRSLTPHRADKKVAKLSLSQEFLKAHRALMGPYGAHMGPPGQVRTWPNQDFWSNLARFGSRNGILTKWHNDSASFLLEKLKNQVILIKNFNIWLKIKKIPQKISKNRLPAGHFFMHSILSCGPRCYMKLHHNAASYCMHLGEPSLPPGIPSAFHSGDAQHQGHYGSAGNS